MPVACETRVIPPRPMALASVAAQRRRARSSMTGFNDSNFAPDDVYRWALHPPDSTEKRAKPERLFLRDS